MPIPEAKGAARLTASEASAAMVRGELSPGQLAEDCLTRIAARDDDVRAWTFLDPELVRQQARALHAMPRRSALHGIPVGIKDILYTKDMPTSFNSPLYQGYAPNIDASAVAILRAAGAVIAGKNDTVEFAVNGRRARTRNPHDLTRTPGGSSSGSAAAVADFQVPLSLGTQTGGSVIRPASYCGVYGMKPTWNAVSPEGFKVCSAVMDTLGWYGRSAEDLGLLCEVFNIHDDVSPAISSLQGARIAMCRTPVWAQALPETRDAMARCEVALRAAGADVVDLVMPEEFEGLTAAHKIIMQSEMRSAFLADYVRFGAALYPELVATMRNEAGYTRADQVKAYDLAARCRARFDELASSFDSVVTPSASGEAPLGPQDTGMAVFNRIWTLLHTPCVNVPGYLGPHRLPVGLTITGPRFRDRRVLNVARLVGACLSRSGAEV